MSQETPTLQSSIADVWYLKEIKYGPQENKKKVKVITQNFNGPCSFIAICNILILRGNIDIQPPERKTVSYEFLSNLVAEYLLLSSPDVDVSAALSIMPYTQKGMDLNPLFTSSKAFRPAGLGGELKLFEQVGISLVHGWLVDPESQEAKVLEKVQDYDSAVHLIAQVDHLTHGKLLVDEDGDETPASSSTGPATNYAEEEQTQITNAIAVRQFLEHTQSQLTYHGLFHLATTLEPGSLVALFRNSHLSVLYKAQEDGGGALYTLVTDQIFFQEPSVVWERLEDVDGGWSTFVDSDFVKASPAGGDFPGQTAEDALRAAETIERQFHDAGDPADHALARQLQAEEEYHARREHEEYLRHERQQRDSAREQERYKKEKEKEKKKSKDCIIM